MRAHASIALALATLLATAAAPASAARPYPRVGLYGSVLAGGYPYTHPDGTLDTLEIRRASRFSEITLDVYPISPYRPDIVQAMKALNPSLIVLAYVLAQDVWGAYDADSLNHIPTLIRRTVRNMGGFLYDKVTGQEYLGNNINIAKKGANGRFVVAEAVADIMRDRIIATGVWDGIFTDVFCHTIAWTQSGTGRVIDYQKAGYASLAAMDVAWSAACDTIASHLRRDGGPNFVLVGNCGNSDEHAYYNGWMRENFPYQHGGTWASNMLGFAGLRGYFKDDADYRQPAHNWLLSWGYATPGMEYSTFNTSAARIGLASAALGEGIHAIGPGDKSVNEGPYQDWWYDEYAVNLTTGQSSEALQHTGWLGQALGPASKTVWVSTAPDAITNPSFETDVTSGWTFQKFAPAVATLSRDATTAGLGSASAHAQITTTYPVDWYVSLVSVGQIQVFSGATYSATFRAKANPPRTVHVMAYDARGEATITVDNTWRQYQAILVPTGTMQAKLAFWIGDQAGDLWIDDVHFQSGVSSAWRRDFENGIVLVNQTTLPLTVPLGDTFRRILGTRSPAVNDGGVSTSTALGPREALFLLRGQIDSTRPAAVKDLRPGP